MLSLRESNEHYPFQLRSVILTPEHVRRQFGCSRSIHIGQSVSLCDLCEMFSQSSKRKFAWPAAICTLLFFPQRFDCNGEYFYLLLAVGLRQSWGKVATQVFHVHNPTDVLFHNFSVKYRQFRAIISEYRAHNLKYLYNDFAFPTIECPAGCATLINTSRLSFVHLLNYWFPKFISFGANKNKLRGMKKDFFQSTLHLETFVCAPHLEVNVEGLFLEVCDYHSDLSKTLIHLPTSPLGNLLHQQSDRD